MVPRPEAYDVCIVGAGAVGLIAAVHAAAGGATVALLEAGLGPLSAPAYEVDGDAAHGHRGGADALGFGLGGSTQLWGGQLWPWVRSELAARPWLGLAGWDYDFADLQRDYQRLAEILELRPAQRALFEAPEGEGRSPSGVYDLRESTWLGWRRRNLGDFLGNKLRRTPGVTILTGRHVQALRMRDGEVIGLVGLGCERVLADHYFLAAGTYGNVALLQTVNKPGRDLTGSGFIDHLSVRTAELEIVDHEAYMRHEAPRYSGGALFTKRYAASSDTQRSLELPGVLAQWETHLPANSPLSQVRELLRGRQRKVRPAVSMGRLIPGLAGNARGVVTSRLRRRRYIPANASTYLSINVEQVPSLDKRLSSDGRSVRVNWRVDPGDLQAATQYSETFLSSFDLTRSGLRVKGMLEKPFVQDTYHLMGGTPLSSDPERGVVSPQLRHHIIRNLSVLGASVFPTGGLANPTFTAGAMALSAVDSYTGCQHD